MLHMNSTFIREIILAEVYQRDGKHYIGYMGQREGLN